MYLYFIKNKASD